MIIEMIYYKYYDLMKYSDESQYARLSSLSSGNFTVRQRGAHGGAQGLQG